MTGSATSVVERPWKSPNRRQHPARLVDRRDDGQVVDARQLEVLGAAARRDVDDPRALVERDLVPRDHAMHDARLRRQVVEGTGVLEADELGARRALDERLVGEARDRDPAAVLGQPVLGVGLHRGCDVRRQRPRRRRPHDERLAVAAGEREAHEERRVLHLDVVLLARLLVLD